VKYIMFEVSTREGKQLIPVIFPDQLVHRSVASRLLPMLRTQEGEPTVTVSSAGSFTIKHGLIVCSGDSETLRTQSKPDRDSYVITNYDYFHGLVQP
jgi:hypothetical protein